jgi:hypothetical protein
MSNRDSNWYVPADWMFHFGLFVGLACVVFLGGFLLPIVAALKAADVAVLYGCAVGAGITGILFLFIARLPLYRDRRFWMVGPRALDRRHRCFYWIAYMAVAISLLLLWIVWLRTR